MRVGENVAALRGEMSQAELATKLARELGKERIDPTSITRLEKGTRSITVNELVGLANVFEVDPMYLLIHNSGAGELRAVRQAVDRCALADREVRAVAEVWRHAHDELASVWAVATDGDAGLALSPDAALKVESEIFISDEEESEAWLELLPVRPYDRALKRYADIPEKDGE